MHIAVPAALENGDVLSVLQGCQKRFIDCKAYGNQLRFGGQPAAGTPEESLNITYSEWPS
jgi:hypothetical protein